MGSSPITRSCTEAGKSDARGRREFSRRPGRTSRPPSFLSCPSRPGEPMPGDRPPPEHARWRPTRPPPAAPPSPTPRRPGQAAAAGRDHRRRAVQEARQSDRRPGRHRRPDGREVLRPRPRPARPTSPGSAPARPRARSSSRSSTKEVAGRGPHRSPDGQPGTARRGADALARSARRNSTPGRSSSRTTARWCTSSTSRSGPSSTCRTTRASSSAGRPTRSPTPTWRRKPRRLLEPHGQIVPKEGTAGVGPDDLIVADVAITRDGKELNKLTEVRVKAEKRLALADGVAEDFAKMMAGAKPGDTRTVDITLSAGRDQRGAPRGDGAGRVHRQGREDGPPAGTHPGRARRLRRRAPPEQFNELVRTRLERFLEYTQRQTARQQVLEQLAGNANWDLPRDLLARQARKTLARRVMEMRSAGMTDEQILGRQRVLEQDAIRSTAAALKEHFVLQKIAETEKLEIEDADIDAEIDRHRRPDRRKPAEGPGPDGEGRPDRGPGDRTAGAQGARPRAGHGRVRGLRR